MQQRGLQPHGYIVGACKGQECPALQVGGVEDHVHALVRLCQKYGVEMDERYAWD